MILSSFIIGLPGIYLGFTWELSWSYHVDAAPSDLRFNHPVFGV